MAGRYRRTGYTWVTAFHRCRSHRGRSSGRRSGGALGGVAGALVGMGIPEYEAKRYEGRVKDGGILLSVDCDDSSWTKKAKKILERTGAEDVSSTGEAASDTGKSDRPIARKQTP